MIISLNWLKQFTSIDLPVDELVTLIGARLVEVESVTDLAARYAGAVVVRVAQERPHPDADKLHVLLIDDGGVTAEVARNADGLIEVVCGAPNVRADMLAIWLPPGTIVPSTYNDPAPVKLAARPLRGVVSNGMLASARELAVGDSHDGIVEVEKPLAAGTSFAAAYELDDYLLDIENKSLTHRPDCFGLIGFAREVAAITGRDFVTPDWLLTLEPSLPHLKQAGLEVTARVDPAVSARYQVVALDHVDASASSPFAIQTWLARVGLRPISAVVDITNYLMYLTGQPLHAFDLDKLLAVHPEHKAELVVREAVAGETLELLDGRSISLASDDIVICAGPTPIALAGAMGGANTEIDGSTSRVLVEAATFDLYRLRTTQMRHGIFSEAITRFTKGQSPAQTAPVLAAAVRMLAELTGAERISQPTDSQLVVPSPTSLTVTASQISAILGAPQSLEAIATVLRRVEFSVHGRHDASEDSPRDSLLVTAPYWRADIHQPEDIAEEVGRINGFDTIEPELPDRPLRAVTASDFEQCRSQLRRQLVRLGANEVLTYNFISSQLLEKTGQKAETAYRLVNSLSPELAYLRTSLLPSLLGKVHANHKLGYDAFALFEMNKTHSKQELNEEALPVERQMLALIWSATDKAAAGYPGAAYYQAKQYLELGLQPLRLHFSYRPLADSQLPSWLLLRSAVYEPKRAAVVCVGEAVVGLVGEFTAPARQQLKLSASSAGFELDLQLLHELRQVRSSYRPLSRYQGTSRDISLKLPAAVSYAELVASIEAELSQSQLETSLTPLAIYHNDANHKTITVRLGLTDHARSITAEAANQLVAAIGARAQKKLQAELV